MKDSSSGNPVPKWATIALAMAALLFGYLGLARPVDLQTQVTENKTNITNIEKDIGDIKENVRQIHRHLLGKKK